MSNHQRRNVHKHTGHFSGKTGLVKPTVQLTGTVVQLYSRKEDTEVLSRVLMNIHIRYEGMINWQTIHTGRSSLQHYAMLEGICHSRLSVLSVTSQCSTEIAKRQVMQTTLHHSPGKFSNAEISAKLKWGHPQVGWLEFNVPFQHKYGYIREMDHPNRGAKCRWDRLKLATFDK